MVDDAKKDLKDEPIEYQDDENIMTIDSDMNQTGDEDEEEKDDLSDEIMQINIEDCIKHDQKICKCTVDDFEVIAKLGDGSFGNVFLVRKVTKPNYGQYFAIKVLSTAKLRVKDRMRTKLERDILTKIKHPFIVTLHYAFQSFQKVYLVLDFLPGGDLFKLLYERHFLDEPTTRFYLIQIILAMDHLHKCSIIYRDLKPENILINSDGYIKLIDFGLSGNYDNKVKNYSFCGTIEYMAPEIINRGGHGKSADWWSLGVMMYEMLSGISPFKAERMEDTKRNVQKAMLEFPPGLSQESSHVLWKLLRRVPEKRLGYVSGMQEILSMPFFSKINIDDIYHKRIVAPYIPEENYVEEVYNQPMSFKSVLKPETEVQVTTDLKGFSYVAPNGNRTMPGIHMNIEDSQWQKSMTITPLLKDIMIDFDFSDKVLGVGAFSTVRLGCNKESKRYFAIKTIKKTCNRDFMEEIRILIKMGEHPNIVSFKEYYETPVEIHMVMEYLKGGELYDRLERVKILCERECCQILIVLCNVVAYLHSSGIVHRDINPSNVMYEDENQNPRTIRLTDFGLAKQIRQENGLLMTPCYTANYAAPEILKKQGYDQSVDMWSVGVVLYIMLTGKPPYSSHGCNDSDVILTSINNSNYLRDGKHIEHLTLEAQDLIQELLNMNPAFRPSAAKVLKHKWIENCDKLPTNVNIILEESNLTLESRVKAVMSKMKDEKQSFSMLSVENSKILKRRSRQQKNA